MLGWMMYEESFELNAAESGKEPGWKSELKFPKKTVFAAPREKLLKTAPRRQMQITKKTH